MVIIHQLFFMGTFFFYRILIKLTETFLVHSDRYSHEIEFDEKRDSLWLNELPALGT